MSTHGVGIYHLGTARDGFFLIRRKKAIDFRGGQPLLDCRGDMIDCNINAKVDTRIFKRSYRGVGYKPRQHQINLSILELVTSSHGI